MKIIFKKFATISYNMKGCLRFFLLWNLATYTYGLLPLEHITKLFLFLKTLVFCWMASLLIKIINNWNRLLSLCEIIFEKNLRKKCVLFIWWNVGKNVFFQQKIITFWKLKKWKKLLFPINFQYTSRKQDNTISKLWTFEHKHFLSPYFS